MSINTILGAPRELICQCCGMPLTDELLGRDKDGSLNEEYCKWCLVDGVYTYSDIDKLIEACIPHMVNQGFTADQAASFMRSKLPELKYWKNS